MTSTADSLRLQHSNSQASVSLVALDCLRSERDRYLGLLRSLAGRIVRLDCDFTTLVTQARDSRSTLFRGVRPLLDEFRAPVDDDDISEDAPVPPSTD